MSSVAMAVAAKSPNQLLVGGVWVESNGGRWFDVIDPSSGLSIASVPDATVEDGIAAIDMAEKAAGGWKATSPRARSEILMECFQSMMGQAEWLAQLISIENGKSSADARGEVAYAAEFFRWYAEEAVRGAGQFGRAPALDNRIIANLEPIGISVLVTPWNFPAAMATRKMAPALAAGCTCILKPASETPLTALAIGEIMRMAGVPAGVVNIVTTKSSGKVISAMLHDPRVRKLSFTGSTGVGRTLLREAADQVISCSMELGGNAPFLVFADVDMQEAIAGAMVAKMRNGGEACTAANRFFVHRSVYAEFSSGLAEAMSALKVGPGIDPATQLGPLVNQAAVDKVDQLVNDAVTRGARVLTGGVKPEGAGFFYPPTVITDVQPGSDLLREEIFGPVAAIVPFDTEEEAIQAANDTEYGLVSYVFSGDLRRAYRVAGRIESGMVGINRGAVSDPAAPFGGMKQSGLGREGGHHGMLEYLETKYIAAPL